MTESFSNPRAYLRTSEAAKVLCVSTQTVSRWANEGHIAFIATVGGHKRFLLASVMELRARLTNEVAPTVAAKPSRRRSQTA